MQLIKYSECPMDVETEPKDIEMIIGDEKNFTKDIAETIATWSQEGADDNWEVIDNDLESVNGEFECVIEREQQATTEWEPELVEGDERNNYKKGIGDDSASEFTDFGDPQSMIPEPNHANKNFVVETHVYSRTARVMRGLSTNAKGYERATVLSVGSECRGVLSMQSGSCENTTLRTCAQSSKGMAATALQRQRRLGISPAFCTATHSWGGAGIYRPHRGVTVAVCPDVVALDAELIEAGAGVLQSYDRGTFGSSRGKGNI